MWLPDDNQMYLSNMRMPGWEGPKYDINETITKEDGTLEIYNSQRLFATYFFLSETMVLHSYKG